MTNDEQINQIVEDFSTWFDNPEKMKQGQMTEHLAPYTALFEPIVINTMKLKNRIVMGPMGNVNMADEMGKPSQKMIAYYVERAQGGAGLITSGMVPVSMTLDPSYGDTDGVSIFPRLDTHRSTYSGWKAIAEGCHAYGAKFFIQLAPGMGRVGNPECLTKKMKLPISASWQPNWYIPQIPCRPIADWTCDRIIRATAQAATDCQALGIDGVYLHGHSGYLLEQMTDTAYNRRPFGKYKDPQRFGVDMVKAIRKRVGPHYPIYYRIDLSLALRATYGGKVDTDKILKGLKQERTVEMTLDYMQHLVEAGVDLFDVDLGGYENWWLPHPPNAMPPGVFLEVAKLVKNHFRDHSILSNKGQPVPIVGVGKLGYPDVAEGALRSGHCDLIMLSRPLLADPAWPQKVYQGAVKDIIPCIGDHEGCLGQLATGGHPHCAVNPRTAFEDVYSENLPVAPISKRMAVVGAGPAGVTLAVTLQKRGHQVTLYDQYPQAGGMLLTGGVPKIKFDILNYVDYLNRQVIQSGVETFFSTVVHEDMLKEREYDTIITCTGSQASVPRIPGIQMPHVISAVNFLSNRSAYLHHHRIAVIGGADVGCEVAHMLAYEYHKTVIIVEMAAHLMPRTCTSNRHHMIYHLQKAGVKILNCTSLQAIEQDKIIVKRNHSKTVPDPTKTWTPILANNIINPFEKIIVEEIQSEEIQVDLVIVATGSISNDTLYDLLKQNRTAKAIYNIGDSFSPGRILEAVKAGYAMGRTL